MKRLAALSLIPVLLLPLAACWDYRGLENLFIITAVALDTVEGDESGENLHVSIELVKEDAESVGSYTSVVISGDGKDIIDGIMQISRKVPGTFQLKHCRVMILGEELVKRGVHEVFEDFLRQAGFHTFISVFIAKETRGEELLKSKPHYLSTTSMELDALLRASPNYSGYVINSSLFEVYEYINQDALAANLPAISLVEVPAEEGDEENSSKKLLLDGSALFEGDKLAGYIGVEESMLLGLIAGFNHKAMFYIPTDEGMVEMDLSKITVKRKLRDQHLSVDIRAYLILKHADESESYANMEELRQLEETINQTLTERCEKLFEKLYKEYGLNPLGNKAIRAEELTWEFKLDCTVVNTEMIGLS